MYFTNKKVRIKLIENDMAQWQLAKAMGVSESVLSRLLRNELTSKEQDRLCNLIEEVAQNEV